MTEANVIDLDRRDGTGEPDFLQRMRPEIGAGGFARDSSEVAYYLRINALLKPSMTLVDLGAGRGTQLLGPKSFVGELMKFQGKVKRVIGRW